MTDPDPIRWIRDGGLREARERCEAASDGPWEHKRYRSGAAVGVRTSHAFVSHGVENSMFPHRPGVVFRFEQAHRDAEYDPLLSDDADFIAHARTDLPAALALLDRVGEALAGLTESQLDHALYVPLDKMGQSECADVLAALRADYMDRARDAHREEQS